MSDSAFHSLGTSVIEILTDWSIEVTPEDAKTIDDFRNHLKLGTDVYITSLPGSKFENVIATAARLKFEGMNPVPHLAARSISSESCLKRNLKTMMDKFGVNHVLLIGGDIKNPIGEFSDTMQMLATGLFEKFEISKIGVAGYPEGNHSIPEEEIQKALKQKNDYAKKSSSDFYVITQFIFEAKPAIDWERRIRVEGNELPVRIGIPGIATIKTLIRHARACGVGPSMRVLTKQARNITKLMQSSSPDAIVLDLARQHFRQNSLIRGVHVYPFGGLKTSAAWFSAISNNQFVINPNESKITI